MKIKQILITIVVLIGFSALSIAPTALAVNSAASNNCGTDTSIIDCNNTAGKTGTEASGLWSLILTAINIMTAGIGIAAVAGIVYGSIMYASAGDDASKVTKAREIIRNVVIGIVAYALMYAVLNFIIPGGLFTS